MKLLLCVALILNLILIACEIWTFSKLRRKTDIFKYYTYLHNFLALVVSVLFSGYLVMALCGNGSVPEFVRGLRYIATCGLAATTFIYVFFLSGNKKNVITEQDFQPDLSPKTANFLLHFFCPAVSLLSFLVFERQLPLEESLWTGLTAVPSCLYWVIYLILSAAKLWKEPYDFTPANGKKNTFLEVLTMTALPISFIAISVLLWEIK